MSEVNNCGFINLLNVKNEEIVYQKLILITGEIKNNNTDKEGALVVIDTLKQIYHYSVVNNIFKCLVPLIEGNNLIQFYFNQIEYHLNLNYQRDNTKPAYQLAILVAKDSDLTFENLPNKRNDLDSAIRRLRMAAYIWQAYIREQMIINGYNNSTINFVEKYQQDTIYTNENIFNNTADVMILKSEYTMEQIRDKDIAQQYKFKEGDLPVDKSKPGLLNILKETLNKYGIKDEFRVACLILDTKYDREIDLIRGHAAVQGINDKELMSIMGSHTTFAWPETISEIIPCFMDLTKVDRNYLADERKGTGLHMDAYCIGIGAFLHEVVHALGCPHTPTGIMNRGYEEFYKPFLLVCPKSNRFIPILEHNMAHFHITNLNRMRLHRCCSIPNEYMFYNNNLEQFKLYFIDEKIHIEFNNGIGQILILNGDEILYIQNHMKQHLNQLPKKVEISINQEIINLIQNEKYNNLRMEINGLYQLKIINDFKSFILNSKIIKHNQCYYKGEVIGTTNNNHPNIQYFEVIFDNSINSINLLIHAGIYIDGIKFYNNNNNELIFECGGNGGNQYNLNNLNLNQVISMKVNAGYFVDGFQFNINNQNQNQWFGGHGGKSSSLYLPPNCIIRGFYGYSSNVLHGLGLIYIRK
ncbi:hypothetical protein K502DRAFT_341473 [Neoconidiobolus thromboides FSU 785]|nr:hypothetical protein K502DRAFT_341473 [Neoconidiobolus thromboides FSU 785]